MRPGAPPAPDSTAGSPPAGDAERQRWARESEVHGPSFGGAPEPPPRLLVFGAVPLSAALARAARTVGWVPWVIDPRERHATAERFPDAEEVLIEWPTAAYARLGGLDARTGVAALTHAPELDDEALTLALESEAFYVGAMGSRRTQAGRRERLAAAGVAPAALARLSGPAGLDLGGETAAEAALAILGEAIAALHGRDGGRLTDSGRAIHAAGRP